MNDHVNNETCNINQILSKAIVECANPKIDDDNKVRPDIK